MGKIRLTDSDYHDMWQSEMRKYVEGKQSFAEMMKRANRYYKSTSPI